MDAVAGVVFVVAIFILSFKLFRVDNYHTIFFQFLKVILLDTRHKLNKLNPERGVKDGSVQPKSITMR